MLQHPFEDKEETLSTRIDHTCLLEDRQQVRGLLDGSICGLDRHLQDLDRVLRGLESGFLCQCNFLGDGQDRALHRADHSLVGSVARLAEGPR